MDDSAFDNDPSVVWVDFSVMESFIFDIFRALGVPEPDARICADVVIESDRRGIDSHGVGRMKPFYYDRIRQGIQNPQTKLDVVREGPTTAVLDANFGMGQVAAHRAMEMAIAKSRKLGMGMVVVRNSWHYGIAGYYAMMASREGMMGMSMTNTRPSCPPTFGVEPMYGTNPIAFAVPTDEEFPFVFDAATTTAQRGKIELYERLGLDLPVGWAVDGQGRTRTDTSNVLKELTKGTAALTPLGGTTEELGGHKGYGLATMVEIMCASFAQGAFLTQLAGVEDGKPARCRLGHFFLAVDITQFTELESFKRTTGDLLRALRASKRAPGKDRIYTAGEKEYMTWLARKNRGIPLTEQTRRQLAQMRDETGLAGRHDLPF